MFSTQLVFIGGDYHYKKMLQIERSKDPKSNTMFKHVSNGEGGGEGGGGTYLDAVLLFECLAHALEAAHTK